jgi:membrane protein required for colicin V production
MVIIDIIILIILIIAFILGLRKGIIRQLFGLAALLLGIYCAFKFSQLLGHYFSEWFKTGESITQGIAFALIFIAVLFLVVLIGRLAAKLIQLATLGGLDRILGGIFSVLKITCICCIIQFIVQYFDEPFHFLPESVHRAVSYQFFNTVTKLVFPYLSL